MKTYRNLYKKLCSFENLQEAYQKAARHKTNSIAVQEFQKNWRFHLCTLLRELRTKKYQPQPLQKFVLHDPKTRVICVSDFRDRIVHHALVHVLHPIFEPRFIYDSYASRRGKGTLAALKRFDEFKRKVSKNGKLIRNAKNSNHVRGFVFKADIRHYFDTIDQKILLEIIEERVKDQEVLWLTQVVLKNYHSGTHGKGMPLGNWTSQFLANVYLNELDQFVKHQLKVKYYIRYVDDFVILHEQKEMLKEYTLQIKQFLKTLQLELHPDKCKIIPFGQGISFLGFRVFYHYKNVRQRNLRTIKNRLAQLLQNYEKGLVESQEVFDVVQGWNAYASLGNTYNLRKGLKEYVTSELAKKNSNILF